MPWTELALNAGSALGGAVVGAVATVYFQRRADRAKEKDRIKFNVYLKLLDCKNPLFWMTCLEMPWNRGPDAQSRMLKYEREFERCCWIVADELRMIDDLPQMENIFRVLFSKKYESAIKRQDALSKVIDDMGNACNPRFCQVARKISDENLMLTSNEVQEMMDKSEKLVQEALAQRLKKDNTGAPDGI